MIFLDFSGESLILPTSWGSSLDVDDIRLRFRILGEGFGIGYGGSDCGRTQGSFNFFSSSFGFPNCLALRIKGERTSVLLLDVGIHVRGKCPPTSEILTC